MSKIIVPERFRDKLENIPEVSEGMQKVTLILEEDLKLTNICIYDKKEIVYFPFFKDIDTEEVSKIEIDINKVVDIIEYNKNDMYVRSDA